MAKQNREQQTVPEDIIELKNRLEETEDTLQAIRQYMVDAFVVNSESGTHVFTLGDADFPYRMMVEAMNEGAVTLIPDGTIFYFNKRFGEMLGMKPDQLIGMRFQDLVMPSDQEGFIHLLNKARENATRGEFCLQTGVGGCIPVQLSLYQLSGNTSGGISIIATDISERRQAEEALRKSETLFRFIATSSPDVIFSQDLNLKYNWIINPVEPLLPEDVIGKTDWDLLPRDEAEQVTQLKSKVLETGTPHRHDVLLTIGENPRWFDIIYQPVYDGKGQISGIIAYAHNVTESVRSREKIRSLASALTKAEQEERHRISQILHDDLQQRLFAIKAQLSMLAFGGEEELSPTIQSTLQKIEGQLADTIAITRKLSVDLSPVVIHGEGLADAVQWLAFQMKEQFDLDVEITRNENISPLEDHMRVMLFRAVRELLFNIVKHAGTRNAQVGLEQSDRCIRIRVVDDGVGFDAKAVLSDNRTAHGLLVIRDRLTLIGGKMEVNSEKGEGTSVLIEIPQEVNPA